MTCFILPIKLFPCQAFCLILVSFSVSGYRSHILISFASIWKCLTKTQSAGHMHAHSTSTYTQIHTQTCSSCTFSRSLSSSYTQKNPTARLKSADEADCWTETCHLWGTTQPRQPDKQEERHAHRWQHLFGSRSSTSRTAVAAKLEQTVFKTQNELSVNGNEWWCFAQCTEFHVWLECDSDNMIGIVSKWKTNQFFLFIYFF